METKFKFNSQICSSREQSEKLLALGLKKETADCRHWAYTKDSKGNPIPKRNQRWFTRICTDESAQVCGFMATTFLPAWSLHRLWELTNIRHIILDSQDEIPKLYDEVITHIEKSIKEGDFNKDYLNEQ